MTLKDFLMRAQHHVVIPLGLQRFIQLRKSWSCWANSTENQQMCLPMKEAEVASHFLLTSQTWAKIQYVSNFCLGQSDFSNGLSFPFTLSNHLKHLDEVTYSTVTLRLSQVLQYFSLLLLNVKIVIVKIYSQSGRRFWHISKNYCLEQLNYFSGA